MGEKTDLRPVQVLNRSKSELVCVLDAKVTDYIFNAVINSSRFMSSYWGKGPLPDKI